MTKKLNEVFNLSDEEKKETKVKTHEIKKNVAQEKAMAILDQESLDDHDNKMDQYAEDAYEWAKDIMDMGMSVEPRHSADMFNAAANMIKVAHDAKNSKIDKRLRLFDLELKRQKLEIEKNKNVDVGVENNGDYIVANREDFDFLNGRSKDDE